jgi:hypothetical protein
MVWSCWGVFRQLQSRCSKTVEKGRREPVKLRDRLLKIKSSSQRAPRGFIEMMLGRVVAKTRFPLVRDFWELKLHAVFK